MYVCVWVSVPFHFFCFVSLCTRVLNQTVRFKQNHIDNNDYFTFFVVFLIFTRGRLGGVFGRFFRVLPHRILCAVVNVQTYLFIVLVDVHFLLLFCFISLSCVGHAQSHNKHLNGNTNRMSHWTVHTHTQTKGK